MKTKESKKYTVIGIDGIIQHHSTRIFDTLKDAENYTENKGIGITWHIMETVKTNFTGPNNIWPITREKYIAIRKAIAY